MVPAPSRLRPWDADLLSLDYDHLQRFTLVARLLDRLLAGAPDPARVVDLGCNALNLLPHFLDVRRVRVTRCDVDRAGNEWDPDFVLLHKDQPLPFADASVDAVVALEVLEHVPADRRRYLIGECLRVARHGVIFTCPHGHPEVARVEALGAAAFRHRNGFDNAFLLEHRDCGAPTEDEVRAIFADCGTPLAVYDNAPLDAWLPMFLLFGTLGERSDHARTAYRWLNRDFTPETAAGALAYRKVYVGARTPEAGAALDCPVPPPVATGLPAPLHALQTLATVSARALNAAAEECQQERAAAARKDERIQELEAELERGRAELRWYLRQSRKDERLPAPFRRPPQAVFDRDCLIALHPLRPAEGDGVWRAEGMPPRFLLPTRLPPGWVRLRLRLHGEPGSLARLHADAGAGFYGVEPFTVDADGTLEVERLYRFDQPLEAVRFEPRQTPGGFRLEAFELRSLSSLGVAAQFLASLVGLGRGSPVDALKALARGRLGEVKAAVRRGFPAYRVSARPPEPPGAGRPTGGAVDRDRLRGPNAHAYDAWRQRRRLTAADRTRQRSAALALPDAPRLSVLLPLLRPAEGHLRATLDSVLAQTYPHWELCVADASGSEAVAALLREYADRDDRVRGLCLAPDQGFAAVANAALASATGAHVALLDADDELAPHALHAVAEATLADGPADLVYSDEDRIDPDGRHVDPFFKPDWSPEYFLAGHYTRRLAFCSTAAVRELGGFRPALAGAEEYDLALRLVDRGGVVLHVPDVLYHRRGPAGPATDAAAAARAVQEHLQHCGRPARVEPAPVPGWHRVRFAVQGRPKVSIVIPSACRPLTIGGERTTYLARCLESIRSRSTYGAHEVIVIDSGDAPPALVAELDRWGVRRISHGGDVNVAAKMNRGAGLATGDHLLFLNDDTEVLTPDWIEALLEFSQQPDVGAVGARLLFPDGRLQHVGIVLYDGGGGHPFYRYPADFPGYHASHVVARNYLAVTGACLMTRRAVFAEAGGFSEDFPIDYNDVDYCLRVIAGGRRVVYTPCAELVHHESVSKPPSPEKYRTLFRQRWGARFGRDPYYNPNLTVLDNNYQLAFDHEVRKAA